MKKYLFSLLLVGFGFISFCSADSLGDNSSQDLIDTIGSGFQFVIDFFVAGMGVIKALFLGLGKLLNSVGDIFANIIGSTVFYNVNNAFSYISNYIGGPATVIISTLFVVSLIRIGIGFVFKIFRLNIDYNTLQKRTRSANIEEDKRNSAYHP